MFYKKYGDTDMEVSAIGFGCMRYNMDDVNAGRLEKCAEVATYAYEQGINYFDTAPFYCNEKSEEITGLALATKPRDSYYLSSKTHYRSIRTINEDGLINRDNFRRRLETTLERMKTDYLDFYHLWCVYTLDLYKEQHETLYKFFDEVKSEGLVRNLAFSSHMEGNDISEVVKTDDWKGMLIGYNALNYSFRQSGIETAYNKGMGVVVMNPLGGGVIPQMEDKFEYLKEDGFTTIQSALRFVASHKEITVTLNGFTTKEHVDDAVKAVENLQIMSAKDIVKKYADKGSAFNNLCTSCGYCKGCPKGIEVHKFMDGYNQGVMLQGDDQAVKNRMQFHWNLTLEDAQKCIACQKCEKLCTQHLPIIERLSEMAEIHKRLG